MKYRKKELTGEICSKVKEENCELVKDLLTYVCRQARNWTYKPDNLILAIPKLGRFVVRKKKLEKKKMELAPFLTENYNSHIANREKTAWLDDMLNKYDEYLKDRENIRKNNYGDEYDPNYKTTKYTK